MPKIKSIKKITKRFTLTKTGKVKQRKCGQDHFNSRDNGKASRNKRRDVTLKETKAQKTLADVLSK